MIKKRYLVWNIDGFSDHWKMHTIQKMMLSKWLDIYNKINILLIPEENPEGERFKGKGSLS